MVMADQVWDTEEVLAFVHDVRPWKDLDDAERAEWVRRFKYVRDHVMSPGGTPWTNVRLAALFGITEGAIRKRFQVADLQERGEEIVPRGESTSRIDRAVTTIRSNPELVERLIDDPLVRNAIETTIEQRRYEESDPAPAPRIRNDVTSRYDIKGAVNRIAVALAAERNGDWKPDAFDEALLYFLGRILAERIAAPDMTDTLVAEAENFLRAQVG